MLTDSEKKRIRAEEIFREQIREELASNSKRGARVWRFLNSAFGLWVLSALVLTGLGGAINWWQKSKGAMEERLLHVDQLKAEIECRFMVSLLQPQPLSSLPSRVFLAPGSKTGCLHEFSDTNLASLYEELARTLPSSAPGKDEVVAEARKAQLVHARWANKSLSETELTGFLQEVAEVAKSSPTISWILWSTELRIKAEKIGLSLEGLESALSELREELPPNQSAAAGARRGTAEQKSRWPDQ